MHEPCVYELVLWVSKFNVFFLFLLQAESVQTEFANHRPTVQEIFGLTPSTSLSSCASSSSSPTFRERSHSNSKPRPNSGTIRSHWPFSRSNHDWAGLYIHSITWIHSACGMCTVGPNCQLKAAVESSVLFYHPVGPKYNLRLNLNVPRKCEC